MSKKSQCPCGKHLHIMNNKPVCPVCDDFLFDIEIECDEITTVAGETTTSTGTTKEVVLLN